MKMSDHHGSPQPITSDDDDNNVNFDSDDDDDETNARYKGDNKRDHHNALERKRRDLIKDSFCKLRDAVPSLRGEKASRAQILKKAAEFIQTMRRKNQSNQAEIDRLGKGNQSLEDEVIAGGKIVKSEEWTAANSFKNSHIMTTSVAIDQWLPGTPSGRVSRPRTLWTIISVTKFKTLMGSAPIQEMVLSKNSVFRVLEPSKYFWLSRHKRNFAIGRLWKAWLNWPYWGAYCSNYVCSVIHQIFNKEFNLTQISFVDDLNS